MYYLMYRIKFSVDIYKAVPCSKEQSWAPDGVVQTWKYLQPVVALEKRERLVSYAEIVRASIHPTFSLTSTYPLPPIPPPSSLPLSFFLLLTHLLWLLRPHPLPAHCDVVKVEGAADRPARGKTGG